MSLTFTWKQARNTDKILREILPESTNEDFKYYLEQIGLVWEVFEVSMHNFKWMIYKNHDQILEFVKEYNIRFKTNINLDYMLKSRNKSLAVADNMLGWQPIHDFFQTKDRDMDKLGSFQMVKKSGGRFNDTCCRLPWQWHKRNFVITPTGVMYYSKNNKEIKEYFPFNKKTFKMSCGWRQTGIQYGIILEANHRKLLIYANDAPAFIRFIFLIKEALKKIHGPEENPFESFAPPRPVQHVKLLIDAQEYYAAAYEALSKAQFQIMIVGWWVSPQLYLRRPVNEYKDSRLDRVLYRAADRGVKIYILVYNQSSLLYNDSQYVKTTFEGLSNNIKVLRHPLGVIPSFWSHHEKAVIVDQTVALMGGIDLCYGRFDNNNHSIVENNPLIYPGIQYNNCRIKDFTKVRQFWVDAVSRNQPRMPWHDIGCKIQCDIVQDLCHHFIEYWNYASFQTHYQDRYLLILQQDRPKEPVIKKIRDSIEHKIASIKNYAGELKSKLFNNNQISTQRQVEQPVKSDDIKLKLDEKQSNFLDQQFSNKRMKSDGGSKQSQQEFMPKKKSRINQGDQFKRQMVAYHQANNPRGNGPQILKSIMELDDLVEKMEDKIEEIDYIKDIRLTQNRSSIQMKNEGDDDPVDQFQCQLLRSAGSWAIGCDPKQIQRSILNAYVHLIKNCQHYVYIQNQFFITAVDGETNVTNQIGNAIEERISRAYENKQNIKFYIVLPLIPGFQGQLDDSDAILPRIIMNWQYRCISRHQNSIFSKLLRKGINPDEYIKFLSLRAHGVVNKVNAATQIIYLHSKVMIVDDRQALIGSANINERSMRGNRDSELCLFLNGKVLTKRPMGEGEDLVSLKIRQFRLRLWHEHFGDNIDFNNPCDKRCFESIKKRAKTNTQLYRDIFHCYPDDLVKTVKELSQWKNRNFSLQLYKKLSKGICGLVVEFPVNFLQNEDLLAGSSLYPDAISV